MTGGQTEKTAGEALTDSAQNSMPMPMPRRKAALEGLIHYEGRPCARCGGTLRYVVSANCVVCSLKDSQRRQQELREVMRKARKD